MNSAVRPIFNENFAEKGFVGSVNSAWDPLEKHKSHRNALLTKKKKKGKHRHRHRHRRSIFQHYPNEY